MYLKKWSLIADILSALHRYPYIQRLYMYKHICYFKKANQGRKEKKKKPEKTCNLVRRHEVGPKIKSYLFGNIIVAGMQLREENVKLSRRV